MITKYFTKAVVKFNPFGKEGMWNFQHYDLDISNLLTNQLEFNVLIIAKTARLFLSAIPPAQRTSGLQLQNEVLMAGSTVKPTVKVVFKDKTELQADPTNMNFTELSNYFDRHSRKLALKESIESQ